MSATFPFLDAVTRLLTSALGHRLAPGVGDYLDLFSEDGVLELPYAPDGVTHIAGRAAIAAHLERIRGQIVLEDMTLKASYPSEGGRVVLEYDGIVHVLAADRRFPQSYIAVLQVVDGRLRLFREYLNPQAGAKAKA